MDVVGFFKQAGEFAGDYSERAVDQELPDEIHRGIAVSLPKDVHEKVHDQSRPVYERAQMIADHLRQSGSGGRAYDGHLGTHWTTSPEMAAGYSKKHKSWPEASPYDFEPDPTHTRVVLHAETPKPSHMLSSERTMRDREIFGHEHSEREIPLRKNAPVSLRGLSFGPNTKGGELTRHDFESPLVFKPPTRKRQAAADPVDVTSFFREAGSGLSFDYSEEETGGSKYPTKGTITAVHPEHGPVGTLRYYPPKRKGGKMAVDRLEVHPDHRRQGHGSALMDEMQRRHPTSSVEHGDRSDDGKAWWAGYSKDKKVQRGRVEAGVDAVSFFREAKFEQEPEDWASILPKMKGIHRGMSIELPEDVHNVVHDSQQYSPEHRAKALVDHIQQQYGGLGTHWSDEKTAHKFAQGNHQPGRTKVVLHAHTPHPDHVETDPDQLREGAVYRHDNWMAGEKEIPLKQGAPAQVHSVTWYGPRNKKTKAELHSWDQGHHTAGRAEPAVEDVRSFFQREAAGAMLDLYHRTTPEAAEAIHREKRMTSKENHGSRKVVPTFFSNRRDGQYSSGYGEGVVHVRVPEHMATMDDEFRDGEQHYTVDASRLQAHHFVAPQKTAVEDYHMEHQAPGADEAPAHDLNHPNSSWPSDVYERAHEYPGGHDYSTMAALRRARGKPDKDVMIHRAMPKTQREIHPGDWVTMSKQYAVEHAKSSGGGNMHVVTGWAKAKDLHNDANDLREWGYNGPDTIGKERNSVTWRPRAPKKTAAAAPPMPASQQAAFDETDYHARKQKRLDVAKNSEPGTHIWRGETRSNEKTPAEHATDGVGMHWTASPGAVVNVAEPPSGHHNVVWHGTVGHPQDTYPRSHPIWSGRHRSADFEAEVRMKPGSQVHLHGAYTWHGEGVPEGFSRSDEHRNPGWQYHPLDQHAPVSHGGSIDYSDAHEGADQKTAFYHGTAVEGVTQILPAGQYAYATTDPDAAREHALRAAEASGREPVVYMVQALGSVEQHGAEGWSRDGWEVVGDI